jgi:aromatic ring hydroxylase
MITGDQYKERIAKLKPNVYMGGRLVDRFDPRLVGGINVMAATYEFARDQEFKESDRGTDQPFLPHPPERGGSPK